MGGSLAPERKPLLSAAGCTYDRPGQHDHEIWYSPITQCRFAVCHKILSRYAANGVLKQAGLPKAF